MDSVNTKTAEIRSLTRGESALLGSRAWIAPAFTNMCLLVISIGLSFLLCEIMVRKFFPQPIEPRFVHDGGFGVRDNEPHVHAHHSSPGDYEVDISTNSDGLRGSKDFDHTTPPGTHRIAILGDSFAFGYGCNDSEVVSGVLERTLNERPGGKDKWEVLNFGVSGYGQSEELLLYRHKTRRYKPDTVILFYFDNDIGNNVVADTFSVGRDGRIEETGKSFLPGTAAQQWMYTLHPLRWILENSQVLSLIRNRLSALIQDYLLHHVGLRSYNEANAYGVALTRALLLELRREVENDGANFIVVIIPNNDDPSISNFPFGPAESRTLGMSIADGRDFVDKSDYYTRDGHWRPSGHRKAAMALTPMLIRSSHDIHRLLTKPLLLCETVPVGTRVASLCCGRHLLPCMSQDPTLRHERWRRPWH